VLTVAYLANLFPSAVEPYVAEEIQELRRRGVRVIAGSVRRPAALEEDEKEQVTGGTRVPEIVLQPLRVIVLLQALLLCVRRWNRISPLLGRVVFRGAEGPLERAKALLHTWMGACYAVRLEGRGIEHIHVHHGYFGSWMAMVAARLLNVGFSMTLHGSDLLLRKAYLDAKLAACTFCLTVSEYNRRHILEHYPTVEPQKVVVSRLGVEVSERPDWLPAGSPTRAAEFTLLTVGRLCAAKDHAFLLRACAQLRMRGVNFDCFIAGDGPERRRLQSLIRKYGLDQQVTLLGHVPHQQMDSLYDQADVVVLTSRSEGIPLVLMEAMARGKIVLAPAITGIPELVIPGKTGFLYQAGSLDDLLDRLLLIRSLLQAQNHPHLHPELDSTASQLNWIRHAARVQVRHNFNRKKNLESFAGLFLERVAAQTESLPHEDFVLQQI
jgi:colanic acid/amylovoran biosynthesis glycosyltransferase